MGQDGSEKSSWPTLPYRLPMTSQTRLGCAAALLAAGLVPTMALPAHAGSAVVTDAQGDVTAINYSPRGVRVSQEPTDTQRDISTVDFEYRKRFAVAVIGIHEIRGVGKNANVRLRLKGGGEDATFARGTRDRLIRFGQEGPDNCRGGTAIVDPASYTVRFKVPARCFGAPDRVRFGVHAVGVRGQEGISQRITSLIDDARTTKVSENQGFFPRLGAAVRRG